MRKEITCEDDWDIAKSRLSKNGYDYVIRYVESLKKEISALNEKIELIEIYYNTKEIRK